MPQKQTAITTETTKGTVRPHQPGQAVFRGILSEDIDWKPFPAFPLSARLAVLVGQPSEPGPYVIRVKVPSGVKLMPHKHPEDRIYTVISGVFYIGVGAEFDAGKLEAYPPVARARPGSQCHSRLSESWDCHPCRKGRLDKGYETMSHHAKGKYSGVRPSPRAGTTAEPAEERFLVARAKGG